LGKQLAMMTKVTGMLCLPKVFALNETMQDPWSAFLPVSLLFY
jgi:hypothetical protein